MFRYTHTLEDLVMAVGTGMGVGLMMALPKEEDFVVLSLEGGHVLLSSAPVNHERRKEESRMLKFVSCHMYVFLDYIGLCV